MGNGFAALETGVPDRAQRQVRHPGGIQPLCGGLGACHGYPISVDQTGGVALGRDAQWDDRPLAPGHQGERRDPFAVLRRDRRRPNHTRVAGLPQPTIVNSVQQAPMEGVSMAYSFDDAQAAERHELQYFEMFCNRGIYYKGWSAVTRHSTPWVFAAKLAAFDDALGTIRRQQGVDPGARSGEGDAGEAARTAATMVDRGGQVQRVTDRRPQNRTLQC